MVRPLDTTASTKRMLILLANKTMRGLHEKDKRKVIKNAMRFVGTLKAIETVNRGISPEQLDGILDAFLCTLR